MKVGVVVFPGSNCDHDTFHVLGEVCGQEPRLVWHKDSDLSDLDAVILPGGFSYGDYLRTGAIARFSPVMKAVGEFARARRPRHRDLQRVPDPPGGGPAAGRHAAQPGREVPVPARARPRRAHGHARHHRPVRGHGADHAHRARRGELLRPARGDRAPGGRGPGRVPLHHEGRTPRPRRQRQRLRRRHRGRLQRGAQRGRAHAAPGARVRAGARLGQTAAWSSRP